MSTIPEPSVKSLSNGRSWLLERDYIYKLNDGRTVFIPAGFVFDYASIPRIAWRIFPPATGKHRNPSLIHDWLVANGSVDWSDAAIIFLEAMKAAKVGAIKRYIIYYAVDMYGLFHKPDPRRNNLRKLQKHALSQREEHYTNVI